MSAEAGWTESDGVADGDLLLFSFQHHGELATFALDHCRKFGRGAILVPFSSLMSWKRDAMFALSQLSYESDPRDNKLAAQIAGYDPSSMMLLASGDLAAGGKGRFPFAYRKGAFYVTQSFFVGQRVSSTGQRFQLNSTFRQPAQDSISRQKRRRSARDTISSAGVPKCTDSSGI